LFIHKKVKLIDKPSNKTPRVGVVATRKFNFAKKNRYSDIFFLENSSITAKNLLYIDTGSHCSVADEMINNFTAQGGQIVSLKNNHNLSSKVPVFIQNYYSNPSRKVFKKSTPQSKEERNIVSELNYYRYKKDYWRDLFETYSVKLFFSENKYDTNHMIIGNALKEIGGISIIWQRAFQEFSSPWQSVSSDIIFGFSQYNAQIEKENGSNFRYHIATGYPGDFRFSTVKEQALHLRNNLKSEGAKKIIGFFDENSEDDPRWLHGHAQVQEDYRYLLNKVIEESWFGLVLKPKKPGTLRHRLGPVAELLAKAEKTGRCYMYEGEHTSSFPPCLAALSADVAIHSHLYAGTAAFEAALAGVPTLLLDRDGWRDSLLYKLGNKVVFQDWDTLWETVQQYFSNETKIGNWDSLITKLDPFRDGRSAERIGSYLQELIQGFEQGKKRNIIMEEAAENYAKQWGQDKITIM